MNKYINSFAFNNNTFYFYDLNKIFEDFPKLKELPISLKLLLESNIRNSSTNNINKIINNFIKRDSFSKINFVPTRSILDKNKGMSVIIDFISLRQKLIKMGKNIDILSPKILIDFILESSNTDIQNEIEQNRDKYEFIKWVDTQFDDFSMIFLSKATLSQLNLEYLATNISLEQIYGKIFIFPESIISTDNSILSNSSLGILAINPNKDNILTSLLGINTLIDFPKVIGIKIIGELKQTINVQDVSNHLKNILSKIQIEDNTIIEFFGNGLKYFTVEDRAILSLACSQYDVKTVFFSVDNTTIEFLEKSRGVDANLIKKYFQLQGLYGNENICIYDRTYELNILEVDYYVSNFKKEQDVLLVKKIPSKLKSFKKGNILRDNDIVLSVISSKDVLNPSLFIQAALVAKKAVQFGLKIDKKIKVIFSSDCSMIKSYLKKLNLLKYFEELGVDIYNEMDEKISLYIQEDILNYNLDVSCITSGNLKYQEVIKSEWLMSPAFLLIYSLKENMNCNIFEDEIINNIYLKDLLPTNDEVLSVYKQLNFPIYSESYKDIFLESQSWKNLKIEANFIYSWKNNSNIIKPTNFDFDNLPNIKVSKILAIVEEDGVFNNIFKNKNISSSSIVIYKKDFYFKDFKSLMLEDNSFLNIKMIVAKAYDRKSKIGLIKKGILPLEYIDYDSFINLNIVEEEGVIVKDEINSLNQKINFEVLNNGNKKFLNLISKIQTQNELEYYRCGGYLNYTFKQKYF